jgi:zinc D-Ala-D-Ala carboxypeptidase
MRRDGRLGRLAAATLLLALATLAVAETPANLLPAAGGPPPCAYGDVVLDLDPWGDHGDLPLDTSYRVPATPDPPDLVSVREAGFAGDHRVRALLIDDLRALREAALAAGAALEIQSAYRSYAYQAAVFQGWVERLGEARALRVSARPGHSEHQLGTAIDFRSSGGPPPWELDDWAETRAGSWLRENAHRYGFLLSYPAGEEERTCYDYEPWHYRWVGRERAAEVHAAGVPLRVWLWRRGPPQAQP